jgi:hypothetical protein
MKNLTLFLLLLPLMAVQCKKDKDKNSCPDGDKACELAKLPPLTTEGKGTFGCLVNGKAWLPQSCCGGIMAPALPLFHSTYHDEEKNYYLDAMYNDSENPSIILAFPITTFKLQPQEYELNVYKRDTMSEGVYSYCWNNDGCNRISYYTNDNQTGFFNVQYVDSARQIISGTFNFNAQASNGETVCVTDGRFDMWFEVQ